MSGKRWLESVKPENKDDIDLEGSDLHRAAKENRVDIARALIARGDDVDARNENGETPLHMAALKESLDVARLLIDRGANTDGIDLDWMEEENSR